MSIKEKPGKIFKGDIIGREIFFFDSLTSTNDRAFEISSQKKHCNGAVIIADTQTHGRGRFGRHWTSPPGVNLYFSVLLTPPFPVRDLSVITIAASVAAAAAIRKNTGLPAEIKWPNDILLDGRKTGGILTEMRSSGEEIRLVIIGIGINVNMSQADLPEEIRTSATSLKAEKERNIDRTGLLNDILKELERCYKILLNGNKRGLINEWLGLNSTIGNTVMVRTRDRVKSGIATGLGENGELLLRLSSGKTEKLYAGEVTVLKKP